MKDKIRGKNGGNDECGMTNVWLSANLRFFTASAIRTSYFVLRT
jgi:hypothetical protein